MLSIDSSVTGIEESTAIAISLAVFFFLIQKYLGPVWIEFNRNSGKVALWRNMKKGGRIGDYPIEQVEFKIGTPSFESSSNYAIMLIIPIRSWNKKYVLFDFYNLDPLSIEDKPMAEVLVKEIEKFIREFMSGRMHQTFQKKEFSLLSKH